MKIHELAERINNKVHYNNVTCKITIELKDLIEILSEYFVFDPIEEENFIRQCHGVK